MANKPSARAEIPSAGVPASVDSTTGHVEMMVPNKRVARWLQLGIAQERKELQRSARRKAAKLSRRNNRSKH